MKTKKIIYLFLAIFFIISIVFYIGRHSVAGLYRYGLGNQPTHEASKGCDWVKRTFSKVKLFEENCSPQIENSLLSENNDGTLIKTAETKYGYSFKLELYTRGVNQSPLDIINERYSKLTPEQKKNVTFKMQTYQ